MDISKRQSSQFEMAESHKTRTVCHRIFGDFSADVALKDARLSPKNVADLQPDTKSLCGFNTENLILQCSISRHAMRFGRTTRRLGKHNDTRCALPLIQ